MQTSTNVLFHRRDEKLTANPAPGISSPSTQTNSRHLAEPSSQLYTSVRALHTIHSTRLERSALKCGQKLNGLQLQPCIMDNNISSNVADDDTQP